MKKYITLSLAVLFAILTTLFILIFMFKYECTNIRLSMLCILSAYGYIQSYIFYDSYKTHKAHINSDAYQITKQGAYELSIEEKTIINLKSKPNQKYFTKVS